MNRRDIAGRVVYNVLGPLHPVVVLGFKTCHNPGGILQGCDVQHPGSLAYTVIHTARTTLCHSRRLNTCARRQEHITAAVLSTWYSINGMISHLFRMLLIALLEGSVDFSSSTLLRPIRYAHTAPTAICLHIIH